MWGYRKEVGKEWRTISLLAIPSVSGGLLGAYLLLKCGDSTFRALVPWLILLATTLFLVQEPISKRLKARAEAAEKENSNIEVNREAKGEAKGEGGFSTGKLLLVMPFQFFVAIYGGYFGAGIGILMLAALGFMGFTNIHRMNGLKNINGLCINAVAIATFLVSRTPIGQGVGANRNQLIDVPVALVMACGAIVGGYAGAGTAKKIGQKNVRRLIIFIGFSLTLSLLLRK